MLRCGNMRWVNNVRPPHLHNKAAVAQTIALPLRANSRKA
jgi:hypothetical protein